MKSTPISTSSTPSKRTLQTIKRMSAVIRVSKRNSRKGPRFLSPVEQRKMIKAWAKLHGIVIVSWHDESDSVSGKTTNREGLNAALAEVYSGASDGIIVAKVDRFCRNLVEGLLAVRELQAHSKAFVAVGDSIIALEANDFATNILLSIMLLFAEWQLQSLTEQLETHRADAVRRGVYGNCPIGYDKDDDGKLVINEVTKLVVLAIFRMRGRGMSYRDIADELTLQRVARPSGLSNAWPPNAVKRILDNRVYLGEVRSGEYVNDKAHKRIVSQAVWDKAHSSRAPKRRSSEPFLLSGIIRCASCGGRMGGHASFTDDYLYANYECARRYPWGTCPSPATCKRDEVEEAVLRRLRGEYLSNTKWRGTLSDSTDVADARHALLEAEAELAAFLDGGATRAIVAALGEDAVTASAAKHAAAVSQARQALADAESRALGAQLPAQLDDAVWQRLSFERKRDLIALLYPLVVVGPKDVKGSKSEGVDHRLRIFRRNDADLPTQLPGRGGVSSMVTIALV